MGVGVLVGGCALALAACGGPASDSSTDSSTGVAGGGPPDSAAPQTEGALDALTAPDVSGSIDGAPPAGDTGTDQGAVADATLDTAQPEAIPGLDSDDAFCLAWSRFTGTFQVLSVPSAFGLIDDVELARREMIASALITEAGAELVDSLPAQAATEAGQVADGLVGPMRDRSAEAVDALRVAGASDQDIADLRSIWLTGLEGYDWAGLELDLAIDAGLSALVDRAVEVFEQGRPRWWDDTALDVDVAIPLTLGYAIENCPDAGALAGIDAAG
jgi:hypothetical protein